MPVLAALVPVPLAPVLQVPGRAPALPAERLPALVPGLAQALAEAEV